MDGVGEKDFGSAGMSPNDVLKIRRMYGCGKSAQKIYLNFFKVAFCISEFAVYANNS